MVISFRIRALLGLLALETLGFGTWYLVSDGGVRSALALRSECRDVEEKVTSARSDIEHIQKDLIIWQSEPFFVERYAREKLAMSRPDDLILFIDD